MTGTTDPVSIGLGGTSVQILERFHLALVASIERANPDYLWEPFTVAEIYEDLAPYRTHRDLIGVPMNGDYEHALMRLLAGDGDYLILESDQARESIQEELRTRNPDTGLYREYAAAMVRLNPTMLQPGGPSSPPAKATLFDDGSDAGPHPGSGRKPKAEDDGEAVVGAEDPPAGAEATVDGEGAAPEDPSVAPPNPRASRQFWADRTQANAPEAPAQVERLESENRRLKILLAERVLEVEELRQRLGAARSRVDETS